MTKKELLRYASSLKKTEDTVRADLYITKTISVSVKNSANKSRQGSLVNAIAGFTS